MQVILKPLSHPQLGAISINDPLFPIGRNEEPFASYAQTATSTLSRRHARIFIESGAVYLADVGSRNGTLLNGVAVALKPVRLRRRDKVTFGGKLEYEIDIVGQPEPTNPALSAQVRVTLMPADQRSQLEPISITHFPFLISKSDPALIHSAAVSGKQINFLSRRHAHIFLKGNQPFLEDLGSTNGTFINSERLDELAKPILNGDVISFGENYLVYTAVVQDLPAVANAIEVEPTGNQPAASPPAGDNPGGNTIFVSSANSFLDIFCVQDEEEEEVTPSADVEKPKQAPAGENKPSGRRPSLLQKLQVFSSELKEAFGGADRSERRLTWGVLGGLALTVSIISFLYLSNASEREIRSLLAKQEYSRSAELANAYLADHPNAKDIRALATEALMKHAVVPWAASLEQGDFDQAEAALQQAADLSTENTDGKTLLDLLDWITRLHRFIGERGGANASIRIFKHEQPIGALLQWWDKSPEAHRRHMYQVLDYVPEFKDINALSFSYMRTLRSEKSVYLAAIEQLKTDVSNKLDSNRAAELKTSLGEFEKQYPRIGGIGQLQSDLRQYLSLQEALGSNDLRGAKAAIDSINFATPPFQEKIKELQAKVLPSKEVAKQYEEASLAWRGGRLEQAILLLQELTSKPGGEMAVRQIEHKQELISEYQLLLQLKGQIGYAQRLLQFYAKLDPEEDQHFINAVDQDFSRYSGQALQQAKAAWQKATERWQSYRDGGGILPLQRLEDYVSPLFKRQAKMLAEAYDSARRGNDIQALLKQNPKQEERKMYQQILAELELQRRSLEQLRMVLSPGLLNEKLDLLAGDTAAAAE